MKCQTWDLNSGPSAAKPQLSPRPHAAGFLRQGFGGSWEEGGVLWETSAGQEAAALWLSRGLASPGLGVYKYALSKPGFAVGPGQRAGKTPPCLQGKTGKKILSSPSGGSGPGPGLVKL